jgi:hypothetical protein
MACPSLAVPHKGKWFFRAGETLAAQAHIWDRYTDPAYGNIAREGWGGCLEGKVAPAWFDNHPLSPGHSKALQNQVSELIAMGAIREYTWEDVRLFGLPHVVHPLFVDISEKPDGSVKVREIYDARYVNLVDLPPSFFLQTLRGFRLACAGRTRCVKLDFSKGYYHIKVSPALALYLGVIWEGKLYVWTVLPFGLASAPYCFQFFTDRVVKSICSIAPTMGYMDDIIAALLRASADADYAAIKKTLLHHGYVLAVSKMTPSPAPREVALGLGIDLDQGLFFVPPQKWEKLRALFFSFSGGRATVRQMLRFVGKVVSLAPALWFALAPGWAIYHSVLPFLRREAWDELVTLPSVTVSFVSFFLECGWLGSKPFFPIPGLLVETDASEEAWGGTVVSLPSPNPALLGGPWEEPLRQQHINLLEILGVSRALHLLPSSAVPTVVTLGVDNCTAMSYFRKGGGAVPPLHFLTMFSIWSCISRKLLLDRVYYIPSALNVVPDAISRSELSIRPRLTLSAFAFFLEWVQLRHPQRRPEVEAFGSAAFKKLPRFFSPFLEEGSLGSFFSVPHRFPAVLFVDPPHTVVESTLTVLFQQKLSAWILVPRSKSAVWSPFLKHHSKVKFFVPSRMAFDPPAPWGADIWFLAFS